MCLQPCRFRGGFTIDREGIAKKAAAIKYKIPRSTLQFRLCCKLSKSCTGPLPVLSEDEEQVLVKWITDCS
jgi:hypothetical protein